MSSYRVARRAFLRSCGASGLLVPLLRNIEAHAQTGTAPLRFLVIHHPLGTQINQWRAQSPAGGPAAATTTDFTLPLLSDPFTPLKSKMVMIDGLNIVAATRAAGGPTGDRTHEGGMVALMTGQPTLGRIGQQDHAAGGRSIDQILLDQSPVLGGAGSTRKTPYPSLHLAADIRSDRDEISPRVLSYLDPSPLPANLPPAGPQFEAAIAMARKPNYPETQPLNVFNRIFASALGAAAGRRQQRVLEFIRADLGRMRNLVPAAERAKLDVYGGALGQLESSLTGTNCAKPATPESFTMSGAAAGGSKLSGVDYYDPKDPASHPHERLGRLQLSMIKTAFQCDLTRVATFMWSAGTNWVVFPGTFGGATNKQMSAQPHHPISHDTNMMVLGWLGQIERWYAQQTAAFLMDLDATMDVDGNSLLDNTVVVYVTEVARAYDHDWRNVPYLVFGGKNTRIVQGGKFLKVADGRLAAFDGTLGGAGPNRPTNDVWLALAPIFGVNLPSLGAPTQYQGPLPGLVT